MNILSKLVVDQTDEVYWKQCKDDEWHQVVRHLTADGVWLHCKTYEAFLNVTSRPDRVYVVWSGDLNYGVTCLDLNKDLDGVCNAYRSGSTYLVYSIWLNLTDDKYRNPLYIECLKEVRLAREKYQCQVPNYRQILLGHMCSKLQMLGWTRICSWHDFLKYSTSIEERRCAVISHNATHGHMAFLVTLPNDAVTVPLCEDKSVSYGVWVKEEYNFREHLVAALEYAEEAYVGNYDRPVVQ